MARKNGGENGLRADGFRGERCGLWLLVAMAGRVGCASLEVMSLSGGAEAEDWVRFFVGEVDAAAGVGHGGGAGEGDEDAGGGVELLELGAWRRVRVVVRVDRMTT